MMAEQIKIAISIYSQTFKTCNTHNVLMSIVNCPTERIASAKVCTFCFSYQLYFVLKNMPISLLLSSIQYLQFQTIPYIHVFTMHDTSWPKTKQITRVRTIVLSDHHIRQ